MISTSTSLKINKNFKFFLCNGILKTSNVIIYNFNIQNTWRGLRIFAIKFMLSKLQKVLGQLQKEEF
jgi:hypothetical protein